MTRRRRGASSGSPARALRREGDGTVYDLDEHRRVTLAQLRAEVQDGRRFRATGPDGVDCTYELLAEVVRTTPSVRLGPDAGLVGALAQAVIGGVLSSPDRGREDDSDTGGRAGSRRSRRGRAPTE
jgi:hypothetical protein